VVTSIVQSRNIYNNNYYQKIEISIFVIVNVIVCFSSLFLKLKISSEDELFFGKWVHEADDYGDDDDSSRTPVYSFVCLQSLSWPSLLVFSVASKLIN